MTPIFFGTEGELHTHTTHTHTPKGADASPIRGSNALRHTRRVATGAPWRAAITGKWPCGVEHIEAPVRNVTGFSGQRATPSKIGAGKVKNGSSQVLWP